MDADIEQLQEKYLNKDFDTKRFLIEAETTVRFAWLCGETNEKFTDAAHPDFQAPPTFVGSLAGSRILPSDFPRFGVGMDAGKSVECFAPIRPGNEITGKSHLHEIYSKTGRSGRMIFIVTRIEFYDQKEKHLANSDSRIVIAERQNGN